MGRLPENFEFFWVCGRCHKEVFFQDEPDETCPYCGYIHGIKDRFDIPDEVRWHFR